MTGLDHRLSGCVLAASLLVVSAGVSSAAPWIEWELNPALPGHVSNPGGTLAATFLVHVDGTTFDRLAVQLSAPDASLIQEWTVTDSQSLVVNWTVPSSSPDGVYRFWMQYHSVEQGLTVDVADGFLVAGATTGICAFKYEDVDGDGVFESEDGEELLEGWEICYSSGPQDLGCKLTDTDGVACWFFITPGTYEFCETLQNGWTSTTGVCASATVAQDGISKVEFGNRMTPVPIEESSWGKVKSAYR